MPGNSVLHWLDILCSHSEGEFQDHVPGHESIKENISELIAVNKNSRMVHNLPLINRMSTQVINYMIYHGL